MDLAAKSNSYFTFDGIVTSEFHFPFLSKFTFDISQKFWQLLLFLAATIPPPPLTGKARLAPESGARVGELGDARRGAAEIRRGAGEIRRGAGGIRRGAGEI